MCKNIFFIFCLLCALGANAGTNTPFSTNTTENPNLPPPPPCTLPGPSNLHTTAITTTALSFAWSPVMGSYGYDVRLTKVSTNQTVYSGHVNTESLAVPSLESETTYKLTVWSVCSYDVQGGSADLYETTDYVIVDDIVAGFQAAPTVILNNPHILAGSEELFVAGQMNSPNYATFKVKKVNFENTYYVHVEFNNEVGPTVRWLIGGSSLLKIPYDNNSLRVATVYIYNNIGLGQTPPKIALDIQKLLNGEVQITWNAPTGYAIYSTASSDLHVANTGDVSTPVTLKRLSDTGSAEVAAATPSVSAADQVQVSPNPFADVLVIQRNSEQRIAATVRLFDLNGRQIIQQVFENEANSISIPTADLPTGMYLVRYESLDAVKTFKVFKSN